MSWLTKMYQTFPATSDIYWLTGSILFLLWFTVGEGLWLAGVKNFSAYTWFIRYTIPRPWLIGITIGFAVFIVLHFAVAHGYPTKK